LEAQQSQIWRAKANEMVEKLQADAAKENQFWKDKSTATIERVTKKMQELYAKRVRAAATKWML